MQVGFYECLQSVNILLVSKHFAAQLPSSILRDTMNWGLLWPYVSCRLLPVQQKKEEPQTEAQ